MTKASNNEFPSVLFDEQAGDPSTPASGFWRAYMKSDGMYVIDDAGAVTGPFGTGGGGGAPTDAEYVVTASDGTLSDEQFRPELVAHDWSGTPVSFASPTTEGGAAANALTGCSGRFTFAANTTSGVYVASAVGTGDFDYRARIIAGHVTNAATSSTATCTLHFGVTDTSGTANTRLMIRAYLPSPGTAEYYVGMNGSSNAEQAGVIRPQNFPCYLRVARSGTTVTYYVSFTEGLTWSTISSVTSSLNVARLYFQGTSNTASVTFETLVHFVNSV